MGTRQSFLLVHQGPIGTTTLLILPHCLFAAAMYLIVFPELTSCGDGHYVIITAQDDVIFSMHNEKDDSFVQGTLVAGQSSWYQYY